MLKNLKIGVRLAIGFGVLLLLMLVLGGVATREISVLKGDVHEITDEFFPATVLANDVIDNVNLVARSLRNIALAADQGEIEQEKQRITNARGIIKDRLEKLQKYAHNDQDKAMLQKIIDAREQYVKEVDHALALFSQGKTDEGKQLLKGEMRKVQQNYFTAINTLIEDVNKETTDAGKHATASAGSARILIITVMAVAVLAGLLFGFLITRSIVGPITALTPLAGRIAEGDLTVRIDHAAKDEVGQLCDSFRLMAEKLRSSLGSVSQTAQQLAAASMQLHASSEQIATGAEEVAAQATTVATAGEEMAATSGDIASNCLAASESVQRADEASKDGVTIAKQTTEGIRYRIGKTAENAAIVAKLGGRSDQIGAIVGTIEDIADQTNLLALNAAIEAARAGEQGRGFAVVADEVRALAERTTNATKEISIMIKAMQSETEAAVSSMQRGVSNSQQAIDDSEKLESALSSISSLVNDVTMQVNQIATAAEEQTATTGEIASNIGQITDVVQATAKGAQESATAAGQLAGLAEELQLVVKRFKI